MSLLSTVAPYVFIMINTAQLIYNFRGTSDLGSLYQSVPSYLYYIGALIPPFFVSSFHIKINRSLDDPAKLKVLWHFCLPYLIIAWFYVGLAALGILPHVFSLIFMPKYKGF